MIITYCSFPLSPSLLFKKSIVRSFRCFCRVITASASYIVITRLCVLKLSDKRLRAIFPTIWFRYLHICSLMRDIFQAFFFIYKIGFGWEAELIKMPAAYTTSQKAAISNFMSVTQVDKVNAARVSSGALLFLKFDVSHVNAYFHCFCCVNLCCCNRMMTRVNSFL